MARDGLAQCLDAKVQGGKLTRKQAEAVLDLVRREEVRFQRHKNRSDAEIEAERVAREQIEADSAKRKLQQAKHLLALKEALGRAGTHRNGWHVGTRGVLDRVAHANGDNVGTRANSRLGLFHSVLGDAIAGLRPRLIGLIGKQRRMQDFVRAVFGETTKDADAAGFAKAWRDVTELARELANAAGIDVRYRKDWHLSHREDTRKLKRAGLEAWKRYLMTPGVLDLERMIALYGEIDLDHALRKVYDNKITRGLSDMVVRQAGDFQLGAEAGSPVRKLEHERFLQFKNADAWLAYHEQFGRGSIFSAMMDHLKLMARELALAEVLGPKHNQVVRQLLDRGRLEAARSSKRVALIDQPRTVDAIYKKLTGELDRMDDAQLPRLLHALEETRSYLASFQLGSAPISALTDLKTFSTTAAWNGLSRTRAFREMLSQMSPFDDTHRRWAIRRGLIAENASTVAYAANRFQDRVGEGSSGAWLAQLTTTSTGLNGYTQAARFAFGMEFYATLTEHAELALEQLPAELQRAFRDHRISAADWDVIRTSPRVEPEAGADFLDPLEVLNRTDIPRADAIRVATKLMDMVDEEKNRAVIVKSATSEALTTFGTERRTVAGQLHRSFGQYKNFAITWTLEHGQRAREIGGVQGARYMAQLFVGMTLLGAFSLTLRDLVKGRDPRDMTDPRFWLAAAFQGGGTGVFGDFVYTLLNSGKNRFGHDPVTALAGPLAGLAADVITFGASAISRTAEGEPTNLGREALRLARRDNPGASLWYARTILDRVLWDQLQAEVDPAAAASFRRQQRRLEEEYGQRSWWRPGRAAPERAPDLGAIVGGSR